MKRKINLIFIIVLFSVISSCSEEIQLNDYINTSEPFTLITNSINSETSLTESISQKINVDSEKYLKIIKWIEGNKKGWRQTPMSYLGVFYIKQGDFKLLLLKKAVVINFKDIKGNHNQFVKEIEEKEFDFLLE